jgi:hypothetical protein
MVGPLSPHREAIMATRKAAGRTTSKKRGAAKRGNARAKSSRSKKATRKSKAARASAGRPAGARRGARPKGKKRTHSATAVVRRQARRGVEVAREGLGKVKELGEKTWGTVKSATAGVVQGVKQKLARESVER